MQHFGLRVISVLAGLLSLPRTILNRGLRELNSMEELLLNMTLTHASEADRNGLKNQLGEINLVSFNKYGKGYEIIFQRIDFGVFVVTTRRAPLDCVGEKTLSAWSGRNGENKIFVKVILLDGRLSVIRFSSPRKEIAEKEWVWTLANE